MRLFLLLVLAALTGDERWVGRVNCALVMFVTAPIVAAAKTAERHSARLPFGLLTGAALGRKQGFAMTPLAAT